MKYISLIFFMIILISCKNRKEQTGWSDADKKLYKDECIQNTKSTFDNDTAKASVYCDCVMERVMKRYPEYNMILRMTPAEKEKYYFICK